jgi:diguanylate cyclase (GGDEF)-like protein
MVIGIGFWATHFVAMLGYRPGFALSHSTLLLGVTAVIGVAMAGGPIAATALVPDRRIRALLGAAGGLGVGAMHFSGVAALAGASAIHSWPAVTAALGFGAAALAVAMALPRRGRWWAAAGLLIVSAAAIIHLATLAGLTLQPAEGRFAWTIGRNGLFGAVALAGLMPCCLALVTLANSARLEAQGRAAARRAVRNHRILATALHNMSNGLLMIAADGTIGLHNARVRDLLSLEKGDVQVGMTLEAFLGNVGRRNGWTTARVQRTISSYASWVGRAAATHVEQQFEDGRVLSVACSPMVRGGAILTYDDVTEERRTQAKMRHLAYHDPLTGLPNRRRFHEEIRNHLATQTQAAVVLLDLDRFKMVNDTLGHAIGDELLEQVAARLCECCRPSDVAFRLGGDEFAILPRPVAEPQLDEFGRRLVEAFSRPFLVREHSISVGCSVGMSCSDESPTPETLTQMADLALYRAKQLGRGRVARYETGMMEKARERQRIEDDLGRALREGEFVLHYQPIYRLPERDITGFEALIRWNHAERGLLSPAEFVPLAEENGMISEIGAWVIDEACREAAGWPEHIDVAVNVSPAQLRTPGLVARVAQALDAHGIAPERLEIELTETAMVEDGAQIADALRAMRRLGVRIAMDDFGTGYSSLAHLRDFELDRIKIDRSFVDRPAEDIGALAVIRAVTGMARDLAISTVGEGVETAEQMARLSELGCDSAQGYFLGRPMAAESVRSLIDLESDGSDRVKRLRPTG